MYAGEVINIRMVTELDRRTERYPDFVDVHTGQKRSAIDKFLTLISITLSSLSNPVNYHTLMGMIEALVLQGY